MADERPIALDPRALLVLAMLAAVMVLVVSSWKALVLLFVPLIGLIRWTEPFAHFWRWLRWVLPMVVFFGLVTAWSVSMAAGLVAAGKLLCLTCVGHAFFGLTPPEDLANALVKAGLPYRVAFVVRAGLQFVPTLGRKAREVLDAQQARGIPVTGGWRALRHYPAFFTPLLVQSFQLAEELAEAMETRGFGRTGRSFYQEFDFKKRDWAAMVIGVVVAGGWIWEVCGGPWRLGIWN